MTLFERVFGGNDYNYARTVAAIDEAIAAYGESEPVSFPGTAYSLPCYYGVTGVKITTLGEMKAAMDTVKSKMTRNNRLHDQTSHYHHSYHNHHSGPAAGSRRPVQRLLEPCGAGHAADEHRGEGGAGLSGALSGK